jgi:hypothetical protein
MSFGYCLSHDAAVTLIETTDIGGTNTATGWVSMEGFESAFAYVELGTWNSSDDLDECRIEADTDGNGNNITEVTTDASGGNYDTDAPIDADGNFVILEIRAEDLPAGSPYIRLKVAEGGNTGTDNVTAFLIRYNAKDKYAQRNGAAVTGEKVYVTPNS